MRATSRARWCGGGAAGRLLRHRRNARDVAHSARRVRRLPAVIARELDRYLPFLATTKVLMAAVRGCGSRGGARGHPVSCHLHRPGDARGGWRRWRGAGGQAYRGPAARTQRGRFRRVAGRSAGVHRRRAPRSQRWWPPSPGWRRTTPKPPDTHRSRSSSAVAAAATPPIVGVVPTQTVPAPDYDLPPATHTSTPARSATSGARPTATCCSSRRIGSRPTTGSSPPRFPTRAASSPRPAFGGSTSSPTSAATTSSPPMCRAPSRAGR